MAAEIVIAVYRARPGQEAAMAGLIAQHVPLLRAEGLATQRTPVVVRSPEDGTFIEIFEWDTSGSEVPPHQIPAVKEIWDAMREIADFIPLADVPEARVPLASFTPA